MVGSCIIPIGMCLTGNDNIKFPIENNKSYLFTYTCLSKNTLSYIKMNVLNITKNSPILWR